LFIFRHLDDALCRYGTFFGNNKGLYSYNFDFGSFDDHMAGSLLAKNRFSFINDGLMEDAPLVHESFSEDAVVALEHSDTEVLPDISYDDGLLDLVRDVELDHVVSLDGFSVVKPIIDRSLSKFNKEYGMTVEDMKAQLKYDEYQASVKLNLQKQKDMFNQFFACQKQGMSVQDFLKSKPDLFGIPKVKNELPLDRKTVYRSVPASKTLNVVNRVSLSALRKPVFNSKAVSLVNEKPLLVAQKVIVPELTEQQKEAKKRRDCLASFTGFG